MTVKNKTKGDGTFKIIICGGRHFEDYGFLKINCDRVISELKPEKEIEIVSGHCKGCDLLGERYAKEKGYKLTVFPADWAEYGKSAGIRRNIEMVEYIGIVEPVGLTGQIDGAVIGFVSENTRGTRFTLEEAQKKGIRTFVFEYTPGKKVVKELTKEEYDNIIDRVFLFAEMNRYYKKDENRLGPTGLAELVTGSPDLNINEKYEIIKRIAGTVDGDTGEEISQIAGDFREAVDALDLAPGELLLVSDQWYDEDINDTQCGNSVPFTSFEKAMEFIEFNETLEELSGASLSWQIIEKWLPDEEGGMKKDYCYYHIYKTGICWFEEFSRSSESEDKEEIYFPRPQRCYSRDCAHLNLAVPFRAGDILRIDCAPFAPPLNALILYSGEDWDCCGVLALYYREKCCRGDGAYIAGAVKHCDMWLHLWPPALVSPLYRLRKFRGRLNEKEAVFEQISDIIKGDNYKGDEVWKLTCSGKYKKPKKLLEAVQNLQL